MLTSPFKQAALCVLTLRCEPSQLCVAITAMAKEPEKRPTQTCQKETVFLCFRFVKKAIILYNTSSKCAAYFSSQSRARVRERRTPLRASAATHLQIERQIRALALAFGASQGVAAPTGQPSPATLPFRQHQYQWLLMLEFRCLGAGGCKPVVALPTRRRRPAPHPHLPPSASPLNLSLLLPLVLGDGGRQISAYPLRQQASRRPSAWLVPLLLFLLLRNEKRQWCAMVVVKGASGGFVRRVEGEADDAGC